MDYFEERKKVVETGKEMLSASMTVGTWGNISTRIDGEDLFAITPSGMDYQEIDPADIVIVDLEGNKVDGKRKPSVECHLHRYLYRARKDIKAVVHTHSVYASAMAAARKPIPGSMEDLVQIVGGSVDVAEYDLPGTEDVAQNAVKALGQKDGVLLANHGVVGVNRDLAGALKVCQIIEKSARITIAAQSVGGVVELSDDDIQFMRDFYLNSYGQEE